MNHNYAQKVVLLFVLCWVAAPIGCKVTTNPPTAPAAGYVDSYDQQFAQTIAAAESFYRTVQNDVNARTYTPTPTELTALNAFGIAINVAKGSAQAYKGSQTPQNLSAAQRDTGSLKSQQQALAAQIPSGVK